MFRDSQSSLRTLWSAVVKLPKCSARWLHHQCASCKEPLWSWFSCALRDFGLSGSEWKSYVCPIPLSSKVPHEMVHEKCLCVHRLMLKLHRPQSFQWLPPTFLADHATAFPVLHRCSQYLFYFRFPWSHATSLSVIDCVYSDFVSRLGVESSIVNSSGTDVVAARVSKALGPVSRFLTAQILPQMCHASRASRPQATRSRLGGPVDNRGNAMGT